MNKIPYYFSENWKNYEIEYLKYHKYKFIKDLSYEKNNSRSIILLFEFEGKNLLRGYRNGIIFPQINYFNIYNIHVKKKEKKIQDIFDYINKIFLDYDIKDTVIYQDPVLCYKLGYSIFDLININDFKINYTLETYINYESNIKDIHAEMEPGGTRTIINGFLKNDLPKYNIYFGDIDDKVFENFKNKHFELAQKETKSELCWNIMKKSFIDKEYLMIESNNNFVVFIVSEDYCYYGYNACTRKDKIVSFLLYQGIKWLTENNYKYIHFDSLSQYYENLSKNYFIANHKKSFCNKIYAQFYLKKII